MAKHKPPAPPLPDKAEAKFVFRGTVQKLKEANVKAVTDTSRTVLVDVEEVVRAPRALAGYAGRTVTVKLAPGERVREGQTLVFSTNGWLFGENLAVQSLGHDPVSAGATAAHAMTAAAGDPVRRETQGAVRQRAAAAPLVVTGKVIAVGEPPQQALATAASGQPRGPISEHDPFWAEAVIEVNDVHKGDRSSGRVVVRFPTSNDAHWHAAPKFQVGQEGVFILHPDTTSGGGPVGAAAAALAPAGVYTCLQPVDFQPMHREPEVSAAIASAKAGSTA